MRVLFYIEPAILKRVPKSLSVHLYWANLLAPSFDVGDFAIVSNEEICSEWLDVPEKSRGSRVAFPVNGLDVLQSFNYQVKPYQLSLYTEGNTNGYLYDQLRHVRKSFDPSMVIMTWQSSTARAAFEGLPIINIEQPPLPRAGHPQRIAFDPVGHQKASLLDKHQMRIRQIKLEPKTADEMKTLISKARLHLRSDKRIRAAQDEIESLARSSKIAIFAMQPPNSVPCYSGYDSADLVSLICQWEEQLPQGWIGVPTFYAGFELSAELQTYFERSRPRLKVLPEGLSSHTTEGLLCVADGLVTVTSTSAMTGLLFGKRVVSVGCGPLRRWGGLDVRDLDCAPLMSVEEAAASLAFLTGRYCYTDEAIRSDPNIFRAMADVFVGFDDPAEWLLDLTDWTPGRARSMFNGMSVHLAC